MLTLIHFFAPKATKKPLHVVWEWFGINQNQILLLLEILVKACDKIID